MIDSFTMFYYKDSFMVSQDEFQTASVVNFYFFSFSLVVWKVNFLEGVFIYFSFKFLNAHYQTAIFCPRNV